MKEASSGWLNYTTLRCDGSHYVSAPFPMPSLNVGSESIIEVKAFHQTEEPLSGIMGNFYGDPSGDPYPVN